MSKTPWFKLYASDYLVDDRVDQMPREAEGLLLRMWCICHLEGSCPDDPEEIARKTRCKLQYVLQCKPHCQSLFELRDGRLFSRRMEAENKRSNQASANASQRYKQKTSAIGSADGSADGRLFCTSLSESESESKSKSKPKSKNSPPKIEILIPPLPKTSSGFELSSPEPKRPELSQDALEKIYKQYPRQIDKQEALKAIRKAIISLAKEKNCSQQDAWDHIYAQVVKYANSAEAKKDEKFIPYCATWMNKRRYGNDAIEWNSAHPQAAAEQDIQTQAQQMHDRVEALRKQEQAEDEAWLGEEKRR